jgi:hypothetical protein
VIVTCGPPHSVHAAGRVLSRESGVPFVMDLRDPWSLNQRIPAYVASPVWYRIAERLERAAVRDAALVVANTEPSAAAMRSLHPAHAGKIIAVMNGSDDDEIPEVPRDERFVLTYAGTIYIDRDPRVVLRALGQVVRELGLTPADIALEFIGLVEGFAGVPMHEMARREGVEEFVSLMPPQPRGRLFQQLARASMLVSLPQDSDLAIPSKVFEYTQFSAWLLALADPGSAVAHLLRGTQADVVSPRDVGAIAEAIRRRYQQHARGVRPTPIGTGGRFSRRAQAQILLDAIERLSGGAARRKPERAPELALV